MVFRIFESYPLMEFCEIVNYHHLVQTLVVESQKFAQLNQDT